MMFQKNIHKHIRLTLGVATAALGISSAYIVSIAALQPEAQYQSFHARMIPNHMRGETKWKTFEKEEIEKGVTIPSGTNVIIKLPFSIDRITRRTLFGRRGEGVRYWGYCFAQTRDEEFLNRRSGFPGAIFLSEKERAHIREKELARRQTTFGGFNSLNERDLNNEGLPRGEIRHQKELFYGGDVCYIMTSKPLPVGPDADKDGVNTKVELDKKTDILNKDTDGDGITDGLEIFSAKTNPIQRDTDGDGLVDGLEDENRNGRVDSGETSPIAWDSDKDGLCDGLCRVDGGRRSNGRGRPDNRDRLMGEDFNLDGIVDLDAFETDPLSKDTDGDGILDEQEFLVCELKQFQDC